MQSKITIVVLAFTTVVSLLLVFLDIGLFEQTGDSNVVVETFTSSILQEERPILIHLPTGYDRDSDRRYPVIYVLEPGVWLVDALESLSFGEECERELEQGGAAREASINSEGLEDDLELAHETTYRIAILEIDLQVDRDHLS